MQKRITNWESGAGQEGGVVLWGDKMCIAIPGQITFIDGNYADVDTMGVESTVYIGLIENPREGDFVLIHAGCAIQKIDERYFYYLEDTFRVMLDGDD